MHAARPKGRAAIPLWMALKKLDPQVQCELRFDWLFVPGPQDRSAQEAEVHAALVAHCRSTKSTHVRKSGCDCDRIYEAPTGRSRSLEFDFFLPSRSLAIEFDERQHFTLERQITLNLYTGRYPFDVKRWKSLLSCSASIVDPDPPCRDWQRAYRDAIRDFRARAQGIKLKRI